MLTIPTEFVSATKLSDEELLLEIAVMLFEKEKLTLGQAARLTKMSQLKFQRLVAKRGLNVHYGLKEYKEDLETIERLGL